MRVRERGVRGACRKALRFHCHQTMQRAQKIRGLHAACLLTAGLQSADAWSARADWRTPAKRPARFPCVQHPNSARRTAAINHGYSARSGATPANRDVHSGHRQKNASPSPKRSWQNVQVMPSPPTPLLTVLLRFIRRAAGSCVATGKFSMARFPAPRRAEGAKWTKRTFCATGVVPSPHARPRWVCGAQRLSRAAPCRGGKMGEADILRDRRCAFAACAATLGLRGATAGRIGPRGLAEAGILRNLRCALAACAATPFNGTQWFSQAVPRGPRIRTACPAGYGPGRLWRRGCFPAPRRDRQSGRVFCAACDAPDPPHTAAWPIPGGIPGRGRGRTDSPRIFASAACGIPAPPPGRCPRRSSKRAPGG